MTRTQIIAQKVTELQEKIKTTNNGYLFACTREEIYIATTHPRLFTVVYNPHVEEMVAFRIYNNL